MDKLIDLPHVQAVMEEMAIAIRNEYQDNLIRNDRIASGDLLNNIEYEITRGDFTYTIYVKMKYTLAIPCRIHVLHSFEC